MRHVPVVDEQYGEYRVVSTNVILSSDSKRMFNVKCSCGREEFKRAAHLASGRCKSCKSCTSKRTAKNHPPPTIFKGVGGLSRTHYSSIKHGAQRRDIKFDLTINYLWDLFLAQDKRCALTGLPLVLEPSIKNSNVNWDLITASVDRKNSDLGYIQDNVWWVHKEANRLKNNYPMSELLYWCNLIVKKHDNPEPSMWKGFGTHEGATTRQ